jgi:hypothetical protein
MMRYFLLLPFLCLALIAQAQYSETFSTPNKGYLVNFVNDFTTVDWTLSAWANQPPAAFGRDDNDYFQTTAAGVLEAFDLDQEVCWISPVLTVSNTGNITFTADITWAGFDVGQTNPLEFVNVEYQINNNGWVRHPNLLGADGDPAFTVRYIAGSGGGGNATTNFGNIAVTAGNAFQVRICASNNTAAEIVTIDNINVSGVSSGCAAPTLSTVVTQVGCSNPNSGAIDLTVSGGTPGYTYVWSSGQTTQDLSNRPTGTYTVTVTDAASCTATISASITSAPALSLSTFVLDASCSGNSDGEIDLAVSGGVPSYTYDWSNDGPENPDNDPQDLVGVGTGTYTVTVTDASGCSATKSATVNLQPSGAYLEQFNTANKGYLPNYVDDFAGVNWTLSSWPNQPPAPFGRVAGDYFQTSGGVLTALDLDVAVCWESPLIDLGSGTMFSVDLAWNQFDPEDYINVLYSIDGGSYIQVPNKAGGGAGTIQYTTLDNSGSMNVSQAGLSGSTIQIQICGVNNTNNEQFSLDNVSVPGSNQFCPAPEPSLTPTNVTCNGAANGAITNAVSNGQPPYTYVWSNGATTQNLSNLGPGTYTVTVTDANMSTGTASANITQPAAIVLSTTQVNVLCNGASNGSIDLTVSGGMPGYSYNWGGGITTQDRSNLAAGTYTVTVTDASNCTKTISASITQPTAIVLTETHVNVLCNGQSNGSIDLSVSGGTPAYTYNWGGGITTQDRSNLAAGTYTVTVTDANNCTKTLSTTITQPNAISISGVRIKVPCRGEATGGLNITVSGGTPGYTYDWSNNGPQNPDTDPEDLMNVVAGYYTVSVTDANGCMGFFADTVTQPATVLALSTTQVNVLCQGGSTGSIDLTVTGGGSPYMYAWTGGATTQDRSNLAAGTYTVTVTDANNCIKTISATITEPAEGMNLNSTQVNVLCNGNATGSIDLSVSGGTPAYTYNWGGGITTQDRSNLVAGTYTVTVTDANNCTKTLSATITQPAAIVLSTTQVNVLCNGNASGSIDLTVSGGTPGYTYSWTGGATSQDRSNLAAGTYTVTVTDANNCTQTTSVTITQPTAIVLSTTQVNVLCSGNASGSIDLTVNGGTPGYTYSWTGGATAQDRSNLAAGTYTVTVTDANNCSQTISATITEPAGGISLSSTQVNVFCNGNASGSIDLSVSGGTPAYTYNWGGGITTQDRSNLAAGTYTVTVTDANNCTQTLSATITQPTAIVLSTTQVNVLCNGSATGSIDLTVNGGTPGYTYNWTGGATTQDRSNLAAGTYTVTVTDANNCTQTTSVTITQPTAIVLSTTQVNVLCSGNASGSIDLTVNGGTPGYTYSWTGGATSQDRSNLSAGTYTVTVTDANNCSQTISATITQPAGGISLSSTQVNVLCNGNATGSIDLSVSGGTPAYTYNWGGGITTEDRSNLLAGTYTVTVTDANNCTQTLSATITQPTAIVLSTTQVNILCNGSATGSIDLTVNGGTPGYTYNWTGGATSQDRSNLLAGTYTVTVTDANNCTQTISATITQPTAIVLSTTQVNILCNGGTSGSVDLTVSGGTPGYTYSWTGGVTTQDRSNLAAGTYTVTVTDANNCTQTISATITEPAGGISLGSTQVNVLCNGNATGSIDLSVSGGTPAYTYNWGGGITTEDRSNLAAGTYTVTVTDANNCTNTLSATITQPTAIVLSTPQVNVLCNGSATGSIDLTVNGGTPGYTYNWTGGATSQDRVNLAAGTYTVTVTDANNCTQTTSVTITQPTAIVLSTTQVNVLCNGNASGSIDLTANGGTPGYTYFWTGGATTQDHTNLAAGTYTVTVTDANNCTQTISATITQPMALALDAVVGTPSNCFVADGSIDLIVAGGTPGYTYDWSNNGPNNPDIDPEDLVNLLEGTYTVTVTDANGCTATLSRTLDYIDVVQPIISCPANTTVAADASCSSTIGSYSPTSLSDNCTANPNVVQSPVSGTPFNGSNPVQLVTLTATDEASNTQTCSFTVSLVDLILPSISCPVNQNVNANASCSGTVGTWSPVSVSDNCTANPSVTQSPAAGTVLNGHNDSRLVTLTATDASGNSQTCAFTVTLKDVTQPNITCPANITLNANASCSGSIGAYSPISLSDNCTASPTVTQAPAAGTLLNGHNATSTVTLTATDGAGNTQTCSLTVTLKDVSPPAISCKNFVVALNTSGNANIVPADVYLSGFDNCGTVNLVSVSPNTFNCGNIGLNSVTLTANDGNGNTATCNAVVTVRDVTPPVVSCKNITVNLNINGTVTVAPASVSNGASDNCFFSLSLTPNTFNCSNLGNNLVVLRATDSGGNSATCTAIVQVRDLSAPTAKCKNPTIFLNDTGDGTLSVSQVDNGSSDACGLAGMSISKTDFNCSDISGTTPVILSLTDVNGNSSSCIAYVTVKDALAPTAICEDVEVALGPTGYAVVFGADLTFNSFDNCSVWSHSPSARVYTSANLGANNLTIAVKDWSGNAATCVSVVTVVPFAGNSDFQNGDEDKRLSTPFDLTVFPNPTTGDVNLTFELPGEQTFFVRTFDLSGRLVYSHAATGVRGQNYLPVRFEGILPGIYLLDFQSETIKSITRLIVQE